MSFCVSEATSQFAPSCGLPGARQKLGRREWPQNAWNTARYIPSYGAADRYQPGDCQNASRGAASKNAR